MREEQALSYEILTIIPETKMILAVFKRNHVISYSDVVAWALVRYTDGSTSVEAMCINAKRGELTLARSYASFDTIEVR